MYRCNKIKLAVGLVSALIPLAFTLTLLFFTLNYMWFIHEVVPDGRVLVALIGTIVTCFSWTTTVVCTKLFEKKWFDK